MKNNLKFTEIIHLFCKGIIILVKCSTTYSILILILSTISALFAPINAIIYRNFLDCIGKMIDAGAWLNSENYLFIIMLISTLCAYLCSSSLQFVKQLFAEKLDLFITERVLRKAITLPMETFDNVGIYNHINMAIKKTSSSCMELLSSISESICSLVKSGSFLIILINLSWKLVPASFISVIPMIYLSLSMNSYWYKLFYKRIEKTRLIDYLKMTMIKNENIKEIKLYCVGEKIISIIKETYIRFMQENKIARKKFMQRGSILQLMDEIAAWAIKFWALKLSLEKSGSLGTSILYINSLDNFKFSINGLVSQFSSLHESLLYLKSIDIVDNEQSDLDGQLHIDEYFKEIEFINVSFKYPGSNNYAIKNISLKLKRGNTYFFVGLNGSGKTTLLKLLLRLYKPNEGKILIDGKDIQDIDPHTYYSKISAIFQDFIKYPFDFYNNVAIRSDKISKKEFMEALEDVGMREFVESLPNKEYTLLMKDWSGGIDMSQGQWQKIAIARCIIGDSVISIFDEPFSNLDAEAEKYIITNLRKKGQGKLNIFITHRFSSISPIDQIYVLKNGEIIENGTHESLVKKRSLYFELFTSQIPH